MAARFEDKMKTILSHKTSKRKVITSSYYHINESPQTSQLTNGRTSSRPTRNSSVTYNETHDAPSSSTTPTPSTPITSTEFSISRTGLRSFYAAAAAAANSSNRGAVQPHYSASNDHNHIRDSPKKVSTACKYSDSASDTDILSSQEDGEEVEDEEEDEHPSTSERTPHHNRNQKPNYRDSSDRKLRSSTEEPVTPVLKKRRVLKRLSNSWNDSDSEPEVITISSRGRLRKISRKARESF